MGFFFLLNFLQGIPAPDHGLYLYGGGFNHVDLEVILAPN